MILEINPDNPQSRLINQVAEQLRQGKIICYPTDTVYGIGCDIFNQKAVKRIFQIKNRPQHKPFSFICSGMQDVNKYCYLSNLAYKLMKKNLPGPYTFILQAMKQVPKIMLTKQKTVGIRVPDNAICRALVDALGNPILNTSAIVGEDEEPMSNAWEIEERFGSLLDVIIDGGPIYPAPSSVVSLLDDEPVVLRQGKGDTSQFEL